MVSPNERTAKDWNWKAILLVVIYSRLSATLCLAAAQAANPGNGDGGQGKVALIFQSWDHEHAFPVNSSVRWRQPPAIIVQEVRCLREHWAGAFLRFPQTDRTLR